MRNTLITFEALEFRRLMSAVPPLMGDANGDGKIDGTDYALIDNGFQQHLTGWTNGDFNGDGKIDGSDYSIIDNAFNRADSVNLFTTLNFTIATPSPVVRSEGMKAKVDGKLYAFGGFDPKNGPMVRSDVYDPHSNIWQRIADLPEALTHAATAVDGHNVYLCGGFVGIPNGGFNQTLGSNRVWIYNTDTDQFTAGPALPGKYAGGQAALLGRTLHYFGGFDIAGNPTRAQWDLNLDDHSTGWISDAPMITSVTHAGYVSFDNKIYVIGGQARHDVWNTAQSLVQIFDPETDQWSLGASLPSPRSHIDTATFVMGNRIIIMGGYNASQQQLAEVLAYSPASDSWTPLTSLPQPKFSGLADTFENEIYFTTGGNSATTYVGQLR